MKKMNDEKEEWKLYQGNLRFIVNQIIKEAEKEMQRNTDNEQ